MKYYTLLNIRLKVIFPLHPQVYRFVHLVHDQLLKSECRIQDIIDGKIRPCRNAVYKELKHEREAAKLLLVERVNSTNASYESVKEDLSKYMGKIGGLSAMVGSMKEASDYHDALYQPNGEKDIISSPPPPQVTRCPAWGKGRGRRGRGGVLRSRPIPEKNRPPPYKPPEYLQKSILGQAPTGPGVDHEDALFDHIKACKLPLHKYGYVPSNGDCWYESVLNLLSFHKIGTWNDALELRRSIVDSIDKKHPHYGDFLQVCFRGRDQLLKDFKQYHKQTGVFTDMDGVIVISTAIFLDVTLKIVATSNTRAQPYTTLNEKVTNKATF